MWIGYTVEQRWTYTLFGHSYLLIGKLVKQKISADANVKYASSSPTNQPQRLTKGGVRRRCEMLSLATSNHSCVRNALLEMANGALN
jgi:hypothetical protein